MSSLRLVLAAFTIILAASPAYAQMDSREAIQLQNQILELRRDMQQMRTQGGGGGGSGGPIAVAPAGASDMTAQLLDRVSRLEDSVRELRGRIDESENARQRQSDELNKRIGDLEFRSGGAAATASPAAPASLATPATRPPPVAPGVLTAPPGVVPSGTHRTPEIALQDGNAALARRDYNAAEASAREVLATGKGPRTTDAQYLLAQSLAGKRDYQGAAVAFDDAYSRNPKGLRAPDSLVGLANSLTAINERKAACETLDKLRVEFPTARGEVRSLAAAARIRAGCT